MNDIKAVLSSKNWFVMQQKPTKRHSTNAESVARDYAQIQAKRTEHIEQIQKVSDIIVGRKTRFSVNKESGDVVISIIDPTTNSVIREIPSVEKQKINANFKKFIGISQKLNRIPLGQVLSVEA